MVLEVLVVLVLGASVVFVVDFVVVVVDILVVVVLKVAVEVTVDSVVILVSPIPNSFDNCIGP